VDGRDEEALGRLVASVQARIPGDVATFQPTELAGGIKAVRVASRTGYEMTYAVHKRHLFLASNPRLLADVLASWGAEGSRSLLRDDPTLPSVLKALTGGDSTKLAALGYLNLRGCGMEALKTLPMWRGQLPADWLDQDGIGAIGRIPNHLTGAAIALSHDKDGLVLDCFSPVGLLVPSIAWGIAIERQQVIMRQVAIPQRAGTGKATLGITAKASDGTGVKVLGLGAGAAGTGGLLQGDKVVGIDGIEIATMEDLDRELAKKKPGEIAQVRIRRDDGEITIPVELGEESEAGW
jgi:hypothetical protein